MSFCPQSGESDFSSQVNPGIEKKILIHTIPFKLPHLLHSNCNPTGSATKEQKDGNKSFKMGGLGEIISLCRVSRCSPNIYFSLCTSGGDTDDEQEHPRDSYVMAATGHLEDPFS